MWSMNALVHRKSISLFAMLFGVFCVLLCGLFSCLVLCGIVVLSVDRRAIWPSRSEVKLREHLRDIEVPEVISDPPEVMLDNLRKQGRTDRYVNLYMMYVGMPPSSLAVYWYGEDADANCVEVKCVRETVQVPIDRSQQTMNAECLASGAPQYAVFSLALLSSEILGYRIKRCEGNLWPPDIPMPDGESDGPDLPPDFEED